MPKESLKDKLDGNELDLSLSNLVTVPVKELASLLKATVLDLSNNSIVQLPDEFCTLTHLVKLDLSKNSLTQLPERIGSLQKLQHLDLLGNQLTTLPVSVHRLKSLKWLDIKDNPLGPELKAVAGNCLDDIECRNCAKNVVAHFKAIESNQEREKQKKLQEEREFEARLKAEEEKVRQRKKAEKQLEKEKRRKEYDQKQREMAQESRRMQEERPDSRLQDGRGDEAIMKEADERSCLSVVLKSLISLLFICVALYVFCEMNPGNSTCQEAHSQMRVFYVKAEKLLETLFEKVIPVSD